jgi:pimeloyl-ACP methyl ester carboxylesterase
MPSKTSQYTPRAVLCLHGILTHAHWQKTASEVLGDDKLRVRLYDFGRYGIRKFLWRRANDDMVDQFYRYYSGVVSEKKLNLDSDSAGKRPSVVAHSFGTYIVGYCMQKRKDVRFDKIILCGSILPVTFDWQTLVTRGQVNFIRNEYGTDDFWTRNVGKFVSRTGSSGSERFHYDGIRMEQECFTDYRHSDYFEVGHIRNCWIPFLRKSPYLPASSLTVIHGKSIGDSESYTRLLLGMRSVDEAVYPDLPTSNRPPWGLSQQWIEKERDIYTILVDQEKRVKGYLNAAPVSDSLFERIKQEGINNRDIDGEKIEHFVSGRPLKLYFMSIGIAPDERHPSTMEVLVKGFFAKLAEYAKMNVRVSEFVAVAWSVEGKRLCKAIGMNEVSNYKDTNGDTHPVFWMSLTAKPSSKRRYGGYMRALIDVYNNGN